jgi:hypothetical protein
LPVLLAQLQNGQSLSFKMAKSVRQALEGVFHHDYVKVDTESVTLTDYTLSVRVTPLRSARFKPSIIPTGLNGLLS